MLRKNLFLIFFLIFSVASAASRYDSIISQMNAIQKFAPDKVALLSLGENNDKSQILMFRISNTPNIMDYNKIGMLTVATHHGNEGETTNIVLNLAKELILADLGNYEYYLIPVLNIPGYNKNIRTENGYDPNRDYPGPCKKSTSFYLKSTKALANLLSLRSFSASATLHGFIGIIAYPWGIITKDTKTKDDPYYVTISERVAAIAKYDYGNSTDAIYGANGCFEDFAYWYKGIWSLLFEIRDGSQTDVYNNTRAILEFFRSVNYTPSMNYDFIGICGSSGYRDFKLE